MLARTAAAFTAAVVVGALASNPRTARADAGDLSETAAAAPSTPEVAEARDIFRRGVEFARKGAWEDALVSFERSNRLRPHVVTLYNIGFCQRAIGRYTRARQTLSEALAEGGRGEGAGLPDALATVARIQLDEIGLKLASVKVAIRIADARLLVDGMPLERAKATGAHPVFVAGTRDPGPPESVPSAEFSIELDPGTHVFQLIVADRSEAEVVRTLVPGATVPLTFAVLSTRVRQVAKPRWPAYLALGAGAAGLALGGVFGILALEKRSELLSACPNAQCPEARGADLGRFRTDADIATGGFVVGIVGMVVGGVLWLRAPSLPEPRHVASSGGTKPWLGSRSLGFSGYF